MWNNDLIQFARMLTEIQANISFSNEEWEDLKESTDLTGDEIEQVFARAERVFDKAKGEINE